MNAPDRHQLARRLFDAGARFVPVFAERELPATVDPLALLRELRQPGTPIFYLQRSQMREDQMREDQKPGDQMQPVETILAFDAFETVSFRRGVGVIENRAGRVELENDPFSILAERVKHYELPADIPFDSFFGSALGYFAYDSVRFLEPRLRRTPGNLAHLDGLAADASDGDFAFFRQRVVFDHVGGRVLFGSGFEPGAASSYDAALARCEREIEALVARFDALAPRSTIRAPLRPDTELAPESMTSQLGRAGFLEGVRRLKGHIRAGDIFQAVLSEQFSVPYAGDGLDLFATLSEINPSPYEFYFATAERVLLGASPEMLLKVEGRRLETHPIAGTRPRGSTPAAEKKLEAQLLRSRKEQAEHLMLVDLARNDIGRVAEPGKVSLDSYMQIKKFGAVMHLVSKVGGQLKPELSAVQALASCFPAGTLSGAPKVRAMELLSGLEPRPRGFYGGAVVSASLNGDLDSCIAIRSVRIERGQAIVQAGAGIVADSKPELEYEEVLHKTRAARRALAMTGAKGVPGDPVVASRSGVVS